MNLAYIINGFLSVRGKDKNVKIAEVKDFQVEANGNVTIMAKQSLSDFPYHYIVVNSDQRHNFIVSEQYLTDGLSIPYPVIPVFDFSVTTARRSASDWLKAKGEEVRIDIQNLDASAHTYSIYLMGVR